MFVGFPSATFGRNRLITVPPPTRANALSVPRTHSACGWAQFLHGLTGFNIILYINGAPHLQPFLIHGLCERSHEWNHHKLRCLTNYCISNSHSVISINKKGRQDSFNDFRSLSGHFEYSEGMSTQ